MFLSHPILTSLFYNVYIRSKVYIINIVKNHIIGNFSKNLSIENFKFSFHVFQILKVCMPDMRNIF